MTIQPTFSDHAVILSAPDDYVEMTCAPHDILSAWGLSIFAHDLIHTDGTVKDGNDMSDETLQKYLEATESFKRGEEISKPVIGIGITDGIEIGIGREIIAAAQNLNIEHIPFHVRKGQASEIKKALKL